MLKLTFLVYAPHSMLLGDFKTLADWMTALIERMEGMSKKIIINMEFAQNHDLTLIYLSFLPLK